jgi:radical SAM family uncharacterized protein/radical SAM-linked protein
LEHSKRGIFQEDFPFSIDTNKKDNMNRQSLETIIPLVQHPSHYLGSEVNAVKKDPKAVQLQVALAFPDLYEVGMSHLGMQILYHLLNRRQGIAAERVFVPGADLEAELRRHDMPLGSLESGTPLSDFHIIGFSLLYELNYTGVLHILDLARVPMFSKDRDDTHPFVIAGGPCTFNPEPLADFFDAMVIGDGENVLVELAQSWLDWKKGGEGRQDLLKRWAQLDGVYVPSFFEVHRNDTGEQILTPRVSGHRSIRKAFVPDLNLVSYPTLPVVAYGKPIHDRLSLEVCRGCTRGCRFCQAGMIYRPVRERAPEKLFSVAEKALTGTGYEDISLLSLSTGDYGPLQGVMERLMSRCAPEKIAVSLPSLRVGSLTASLMSQIKRVRKTGFTIAPEAGSQRLRDVINKNITEEALAETLQQAFGLGWRLVKLYFMIGLPTETDEDLHDIVRLVRRLQKIPVRGRRRGDITVSVSTFIPKAHTPFQWCSQISLDESRDKISMLRDTLRGKGLRFKWQNPEMSLLEGLWARGDRRLSRLLVRAYEMGCRLDSWSEKFLFNRWQEALEATGVDLDFFAGAKDLSEPLPWDHIDCGVSKGFLKEEWEKALAGTTTQDCRQGQCQECGVCNFETVEPIVFDAQDLGRGREVSVDVTPTKAFKKLKVFYEKRGQARFFGHLEMVKILLRAFRRARIPLRFSEGFHPAPKVSFNCALPVGLESTQEHFTMEVPLFVQPRFVLERVNQELPEGLWLTACKGALKNAAADTPKGFQYEVTLKGTPFSKEKVEAFWQRPQWLMERKNKKGRIRAVDLKEVVTELRIVSPHTARMTLDVSSGSHVRPTEVLDEVFCLGERALKLASIVKAPVPQQQ